jgi:hypothetical protein
VPVLSEERQTPPTTRPGVAPGPLRRYFSSLSDISSSPASWDRITYLALFALVALWAMRFYSTWGTWGDLSIDSGHEAYIPAVLANGKMLYRDVWWMYTPAAPYFNSVLFRVFGARLEVLYWAGSLTALGSAVVLFVTGKRLSSWLAGWTAGAVVLLQAFHDWHFSFPLPYSFAPVYGCLAACFFLCCAVHASFSSHWLWMFGAGTSAALALLLKMEFGAACYLTLSLFIAGRALQAPSRKNILTDIAVVLPGIVVCAVVIHWMISIAGVQFITQENISSWPTSYFMKVYGKVWLEKTGFALSLREFRGAFKRDVFFVGILAELYLLARWKRPDARSAILRIAVGAALIIYAVLQHWSALGILAALVFPRDMVLYVLIAAALSILFFLRHRSNGALAVAIVLSLSSLLAFRLLLRMVPGGYPIYYNGPVVLAYLLLVCAMLPRKGRSPKLLVREELLLCLGCLVVVAIYSIQYTADRSDSAWLVTDRGSILVPKQVAANYQAGISFMKQKALMGEVVLSVPEDTSLYFLSGTECPTRIFTFSPGVVPPGKPTDETIREIERHRVRYLLWSNRTYPDYGTPVFGVDFDQTLGNYLTSHYRLMGPLVPGPTLDWETSFTVWERKENEPPELGASH